MFFSHVSQTGVKNKKTICKDLQGIQTPYATENNTNDASKMKRDILTGSLKENCLVLNFDASNMF